MISGLAIEGRLRTERGSRIAESRTATMSVVAIGLHLRQTPAPGRRGIEQPSSSLLLNPCWDAGYRQNPAQQVECGIDLSDVIKSTHLDQFSAF